MFPVSMTKLTSRLAKALLVGVSAVLVLVGVTTSASADVLNPLPANATAFQRTFQPFFDYDGDGCLPVAAIDGSGRLNGGLKDTGPVTGGCRSNHLGKANTYSRSKCNHGWCAISYTLYFEKDMSCADCTSTSHRHEWEGVVCWVPEGKSTPAFVSVSRHGDYEIKSWNNVPAKSGSRVMAIYHKDGVGTHNMRFARAGEQPEAWGSGRWDEPALVGWDKLQGGLRDKLNYADWGDANFPLRDARFATELSRAMPAGIAFKPNG